MLPVVEPVPDPKTSDSPAAGHPESAEGVAPEAVGAKPAAGGGQVEVRVSGRGGIWWARVIGSAGRAQARSASLLLLAFRCEGAEAPTLEALVAGRSLADVPDDALELALSKATAYPSTFRKRPFFEEADGARRT